MQNTFRFPAEWEPQEAIWLNWAQYNYSEQFSVNKLQLDIIRAIVPTQKVNVIVKDIICKSHFLKSLQSALINSPNIGIFMINHEEFWCRDNGPNFIINDENRLGIVNFKFNFWGYQPTNSPECIAESQIQPQIANIMGIHKTFNSNLVSEGGSREVNGEGTMMMFKSVEEDRNPHMSLPQIEEEYCQLLGLDQIIWIPYPSIYDDKHFLKKMSDDGESAGFACQGHIDGYARFVGPNTILYQRYECEDGDEFDQEEQFRMQKNLEALQDAVTLDGEPFELIEMPKAVGIMETITNHDVLYNMIKYGDKYPPPNAPHSYHSTMQVARCTGYMNFLICNEVVIGMKHWRQGLDLSIKQQDIEAENILREVFPDKNVIILDAAAVNIGGGGIHCITNNQPHV